jgi:hypothetical protein
MKRSGTPQSPVSGAKGRKCAHSTGKIFEGRFSRFTLNRGHGWGLCTAPLDNHGQKPGIRSKSPCFFALNFVINRKNSGKVEVVKVKVRAVRVGQWLN